MRLKQYILCIDTPCRYDIRKKTHNDLISSFFCWIFTIITVVPLSMYQCWLSNKNNLKYNKICTAMKKNKHHICNDIITKPKRR